MQYYLCGLQAQWLNKRKNLLLIMALNIRRYLLIGKNIGMESWYHYQVLILDHVWNN